MCLRKQTPETIKPATQTSPPFIIIFTMPPRPLRQCYKQASWLRMATCGDLQSHVEVKVCVCMRANASHLNVARCRYGESCNLLRWIF